MWNHWGNSLIVGSEQAGASTSHVKIYYDSEAEDFSAQAIVVINSPDAHIYEGNGQAAIRVSPTGWARSPSERTSMMAHELGHFWGIDDLPTTIPNSIYAYNKTYSVGAPTRADKNALCIGDPWFLDAGDNLKYLKTPNVFAQNEFVTTKKTLCTQNECWFNGNGIHCIAYRVSYDANGGANPPGWQAQLVNQPVYAAHAAPATPKRYTLSYNANGGSVYPTSKDVDCGFSRWTTAANGTGNTYYQGNAFMENRENAWLYAQWNNPQAGTLPTPNRSGFDFVGWYTASSGGTQVTSSTTITANMTLDDVLAIRSIIFGNAPMPPGGMERLDAIIVSPELSPAELKSILNTILTSKMSLVQLDAFLDSTLAQIEARK